MASIVVYGAGGKAGSIIVAEAARRGHSVVAGKCSSQESVMKKASVWSEIGQSSRLRRASQP